MITFKQLLESGVMPSHPNKEKTVAESGISLRASIIKHYGGSTHANFGSNPYASYRVSQLSIPKNSIDNLKNHFESHGWKIHHNNLNNTAKREGVFKMVHPTNDAVHMIVAPNRNTIAADHLAHIDIYSPKKAKISNLPYYD